MAEKGCLKDGIFNNLEVDGLLLSKNVELTSKTTQKPVLTLENTTNDANGAILKFVKDKGAAGAANDVNGLIQFFGDDANQDQVMFSELKSQVKVHTNGQEGGKLTFSVAEHDGTSTAGLTIEDGDADGELDVTIGAGATSLTTITGNLDVTGNLTVTGGLVDLISTLETKTDDFTAEAGKEYIVNKADGAAIVLPAASIGARITILIGTLITSNSTTITAEGGDLLKGYAFLEATDAANNKTMFVPDGSDDLVITLNGSTKGGLIGDRIELVGISTTEWRVRATLSHTGTAATPFS